MKANKRGLGQVKRRARDGFFKSTFGKIVLWIFWIFIAFIAYALITE
jgi:hypothetical protein